MALGLIFCLIFCYRAAIFDSKEKDSKGIQKSSPGAECKMKEFWSFSSVAWSWICQVRLMLTLEQLSLSGPPQMSLESHLSWSLELTRANCFWKSRGSRGLTRMKQLRLLLNRFGWKDPLLEFKGTIEWAKMSERMWFWLSEFLGCDECFITGGISGEWSSADSSISCEFKGMRLFRSRNNRSSGLLSSLVENVKNVIFHGLRSNIPNVNGFLKCGLSQHL